MSSTWRKSSYSVSGHCVECASPRWRKSRRSNPSGNCVECASARFRKSRRSTPDCSCVEVAELERDVAVRDSKTPNRAVLHFGARSWTQFLAGVRAGEFDR